MEKIDILLATYNGEKYLKEQIESILKQTHTNFRLLISDDCSTDNTKRIIEEYSRNDDRIEFYFNDENLGVVNNFEFLMKNVKNEYFMFSDQDDVWNENKIELSLKKLKEENADLVYTDLEIVDDNLKTVYKSYWKQKGLEKKVKKYNNFEALYLNNFVTGCTIFCKSSWINKILPIPKNSKYILHDYWLALIVAMKGKIVYEEQPTIKYRQHSSNSIGSKTVSKSMNSIDEIRGLFIEVKLEHFKIFLENKDKFPEEINKLSDTALKYYKKLSENKKVNIRDLILFFKLYKYENFVYKMENLIILNFRLLGKLLFKFFR